jgi:hypothetical protein
VRHICDDVKRKLAKGKAISESATLREDDIVTNKPDGNCRCAHEMAVKIFAVFADGSRIEISM